MPPIRDCVRFHRDQNILGNINRSREVSIWEGIGEIAGKIKWFELSQVDTHDSVRLVETQWQDTSRIGGRGRPDAKPSASLNSAVVD